MNICILQHVPFEGAGTILPYFDGRNHHIELIHCYKAHQLPAIESVDLLIIMGGPMSVQDTEQYPYLKKVKKLIADAIQQNKWILGICLGAQLVSEALGAKVVGNANKEIGWYPVKQVQAATDSWLSDLLPCEFTCLHWHGDTFDIPAGAVHIARSAACENQAFVWKKRVIGLQFHLEFTADSTRALIERSRHELVEQPWIQTEQQLIAEQSRFDTANQIMADLLQHIEAEISFRLHPQLQQDCHLIADLECSQLLLHKNAEIPWFILVPRGVYKDLDDMPRLRRHRLFEESDFVAALLRTEYGAEKTNVAALGNQVAQLHLHVIGRRADDPCWPNPVWGNLHVQSHWQAGQLDRIRALFADAVKPL